ncbi:LysR family transcriptional regulator [Nocardioides yefusunii]|uniref:LysR family transcriptional regulator n=1 Tax=Nocardioides yefusunii TaxID=2500546 RepID=A0ABW1QY25_9ACTN|nr:LysR family transcriptional regulator [Nocardioides yefusunii]
MRIEQLEYVVAVTRFGSLRKASERLHLSQPALSEAVSKLERELGVPLLDRRRSGSRISREGRALLPAMVDVLESVRRLRQEASDQELTSGVLRVGTVNAGTSAVLVPAVHAWTAQHPGAQVEILPMQQDDIRTGLLEGSLDLGLVNLLDTDDRTSELSTTDLLHGRAVVVLRSDHPLAERTEVTIDELRQERFVLMRAGYLMHRFAHRLFGAEPPAQVHSTDGAELGKMMVAEGLGVTLLPNYSVEGDPLHRAGVIVTRPVADDRTSITLVLEHRPGPATGQVRSLVQHLVAAAGAHQRAS